MTATLHQREVEANGIGFRVASGGREQAEPILCLHGFPEGWVSWRPVMQRLAETHRVAVPELRGYPDNGAPRDPFDVMTLTDDVARLIDALGLERPTLLTHDWGGALGWIFAHRYSDRIRRLIVVNCTHPRTLVRAVFHFEDWQTLRIPWVPFFEIPWLPETLLSSSLGRRILRWSFTVREGSAGRMDRALVDEIVARFQRPPDIRGPIEWYRAFVATHLSKARRRALFDVYAQPIGVPTTMIWGMEDGALSSQVARKSGADAGCEVEWRPLEGIGHFVNLEAVDLLVDEVRRLVPAGAPAMEPDTRPDDRRDRGRGGPRPAPRRGRPPPPSPGA